MEAGGTNSCGGNFVFSFTLSMLKLTKRSVTSEQSWPLHNGVTEQKRYESWKKVPKGSFVGYNVDFALSDSM